MVTIVLAILTGAVFWHLSDDLTGVHNRTGHLFFVVVYFSLASTSSVGRCALLSPHELGLHHLLDALSPCKTWPTRFGS